MLHTEDIDKAVLMKAFLSTWQLTTLLLVCFSAVASAQGVTNAPNVATGTIATVAIEPGVPQMLTPTASGAAVYAQDIGAGAMNLNRVCQSHGCCDHKGYFCLLSGQISSNYSWTLFQCGGGGLTQTITSFLGLTPPFTTQPITMQSASSPANAAAACDGYAQSISGGAPAPASVSTTATAVPAAATPGIAAPTIQKSSQ
jgi:hypothetical protein